VKRSLFVLAVLCSGCVHVHRTRNAPGHVDIREPPAAIESVKVERPRDPGENMLALSPGPFVGGGGWAAGNRTGGSYAVGTELSLLYGRSQRSHADDDFLVYPVDSVGVNAGATFASTEGVGLDRLYGELQLAQSLSGVAAGWAVERRTGASGPQITGFVGPLYVRSTTLLDQGTELTAGLVFKLPVVWVWSQ
jgi:hypothetical protein